MRTGAGRHAATASRPAVALIMLLAGSLVTLAGVAGIVAGALSGRGLDGLGLGGSGQHVAGPVPRVAVPQGPIARLPDAASETALPKPVFLVIPAIGVRTRLIRLGITSQGAMAVPATTSVAGWYTASPPPGAIGPAVLAGHVDSYKGPGVFYRLRDLHPGDRAFVVRANGTLAIFKITQVRLYSKTAFPAKAVYGPVPYAALRLITCGGYFDRGTGSYLSNVVAFGYEVSSPS
jgi:hypothetical protein